MTAREWLTEHCDEGVLLADGFDEALLGYAYSSGRGSTAVYDAERCIQVLRSHGLSETEAAKYFDLNVEGHWAGKETPVFLHRFVEDEVPAGHDGSGVNGK